MKQSQSAAPTAKEELVRDHMTAMRWTNDVFSRKEAAHVKRIAAQRYRLPLSDIDAEPDIARRLGITPEEARHIIYAAHRAGLWAQAVRRAQGKEGIKNDKDLHTSLR